MISRRIQASELSWPAGPCQIHGVSTWSLPLRISTYHFVLRGSSLQSLLPRRHHYLQLHRE